MKNFHKIYQDTITAPQVDTTSVSNEILNVVDSTIKETKNDSLVTLKRNSIQSQKKDTSQKSAINIKKEVTQQKVELNSDLSKTSNEVENNEPIVPDNFLKIVGSHGSAIKPADVFINQSKEELTIIKQAPGIERTLITNDWLLPVLFLSLGIMIWVRRAYYHHVELLFSSINNYQMSLKLFNDPSTRFRHLSYILNANAALTVGLFLHQLANYYDVTLVRGGQFINYLFIVLILVVIYIFQFVGYSVLGNFTQGQKDYYEFLHHTYALNKVLGIIFIPVVLINAYASDIVLPYFFIPGLIIILIFYIKRIQRGILILVKKQFLKFHQILYFCTLEILPIMVISKFINDLVERSF